MRRKKLRHRLLFLFEKNLHAANRAREAAQHRQGQHDVAAAEPEHLEPTAGTTAVAVTGVFRLGERALEPRSLRTSVAPSFHWYLTLTCDLPPIVCRYVARRRPAGRGPSTTSTARRGSRRRPLFELSSRASGGHILDIDIGRSGSRGLTWQWHARRVRRIWEGWWAWGCSRVSRGSDRRAGTLSPSMCDDRRMPAFARRGRPTAQKNA